MTARSVGIMEELSFPNGGTWWPAQKSSSALSCGSWESARGLCVGGASSARVCPARFGEGGGKEEFSLSVALRDLREKAPGPVQIRFISPLSLLEKGAIRPPNPKRNRHHQKGGCSVRAPGGSSCGTASSEGSCRMAPSAKVMGPPPTGSWTCSERNKRRWVRSKILSTTS